MSKISILIADDHGVVRDGLRQLLNHQADMTVVGEAADGHEAVEKARSLKPDVIIIDIAMPKLGGLEAVGLIRDVAPDTRIVVLSMHSKEDYVRQVLSAGAMAYVLKASPTSDILEAIRKARDNEYFLSSRIRADVVAAFLDTRAQPPPMKGYDLLSDREQQVFRLVAEGNSTNEIANLLCLSPKTVEKHRTNLMKKLGLSDRFELVKFAVKIGLVDPELWQM